MKVLKNEIEAENFGGRYDINDIQERREIFF